MDNHHNEEMPTVLIRKKLKTVPKKDYDELLSLYNEVVGIGYDLLEMIDQRDAMINDLVQENNDLRAMIENNGDIGFSYNRNKPGKKFQGATLSYNPHTKSLGIGLKFSH